MQNKEKKRFTKKQGAMLVLSLCLVGGAAATTFYTMNQAEKAREEEQLVDLNEAAKNEETEVEIQEETEAEQANAGDVDADLPLANEMDVDPASLIPEETQDFVSEEESVPSEDVSSSAILPTVSFDDATPLVWPVAGSVVIDYSMDATVYFPTLDQYKYSPALVIGAETGGQVISSARGIVESIRVDEETGTTLTMNLGNQYELIYGQLKEVAVAEGDVIESGQLLGYVSEPTKYYCEEGSNLYFAMKKDGEPIDPFLYLNLE